MKPQKPKSGKVLRIDALTYNFIQEKRRRGETLVSLVRRLIGLPSRKGIVDRPVVYALPSDLFPTVEEARGAAVVKSVKMKLKRAEEPIPIREVS